MINYLTTETDYVTHCVNLKPLRGARPQASVLNLSPLCINKAATTVIFSQTR